MSLDPVTGLQTKKKIGAMQGIPNPLGTADDASAPVTPYQPANNLGSIQFDASGLPAVGAGRPVNPGSLDPGAASSNDWINGIFQGFTNRPAEGGHWNYPDYQKLFQQWLDPYLQQYNASTQASQLQTQASVDEANRRFSGGDQSTTARLGRAHNENLLMMRNALAGRGILNSGETQYQTGRENQNFANSREDASNSLLDYLRNVEQSMLDSQQGRLSALQQQKMQLAQMLAGMYQPTWVGDPTKDPATSWGNDGANPYSGYDPSGQNRGADGSQITPGVYPGDDPSTYDPQWWINQVNQSNPGYDLSMTRNILPADQMAELMNILTGGDPSRPLNFGPQL